MNRYTQSFVDFMKKKKVVSVNKLDNTLKFGLAVNIALHKGLVKRVNDKIVYVE